MPRIVDKDAKREQLILAASRTFAAQGYEAAVMADVAREAGVSKGSLYDYFRTKEDLFFGVAQRLYDGMLEQARAAVSAVEDPSEALAALVTGSIQGLRENLSVYPLTLEVLSAAAAGEGRQRFAEQMRGVYAAYREIVAGLVRAGQRRGAFAADADAEAVAAHLVAAVDGLMLQYWLDRELDVEKAARELLRVTTRGLA